MKTWLDVKQVLLDTLPLFLATGKGVLNDEVPQTPRESMWGTNDGVLQTPRESSGGIHGTGNSTWSL